MLFVGCLILVKMCACHSPRDPEWLPTYSEPQNWFLWWLRINTYRTEGTEGTCSSEIQSTSPLSPSPPSMNQSFFCATSTTSPFWGRPDDTATCHPVIYMGEVGEGAVSPLELKNILEGCNFYRQGYHANDSLLAQQG